MSDEPDPDSTPPEAPEPVTWPPIESTKPGVPYTYEPLTGPEIFDLRTRWTARHARAATGIQELQELLGEAQYDMARLLRHLDAFSGPPEIRK